MFLRVCMTLKFELMVDYIEDIIFLLRDFIMSCCLGSWFIYELVQTEGLRCFQFTYEFCIPCGCRHCKLTYVLIQFGYDFHESGIQALHITV